MEKEEIYKRIDAYLDYLANPRNKAPVKLDKFNWIDSNAIRTLKHYELVIYRYPADENNSMVDITTAGTEVKLAGGIKKYIEFIENKRNLSAASSPINHLSLSNKSANSSNKKNADKKIPGRYEHSGAYKTYLVLGIILALVALYKALHDFQMINF